MSEIHLSDDRRKLDVARIHGWLASSYWSPGIARDLVEQAISESHCLGAYRDGEQLGFARMITDHATFAWLADVYVGTQESPPGELEALRPAIDHHFGKPTVEEIIASLGREEDPRYREWAAKSLEALAKRSPTLLAVTLEQIRRGATLSLADCFRMELNLMHACFEHGDMMEGIRALLGKDTPRWKPRGPIEAFFRPRWKGAAHPLASLR